MEGLESVARARRGRNGGFSLPLVLLAGVGILGVAAWIYSYACPCERIPGAYLFGNEVSEPVRDWSFANTVPLCQVEVWGWLPHSVNVNCMASDGRLFVSCSRCAAKRWSNLALENPRGRIRLGDDVYPVTLKRVTDPAELDEAWRARARKLGPPADSPRPDHWWSFRLESRGE